MANDLLIFDLFYVIPLAPHSLGEGATEAGDPQDSPAERPDSAFGFEH